MATDTLVDGPRHASDANLIKIVRNLDKGTQPTPEKLRIIWTGLSSTSEGSFHASEEMVLRWLLKSMKADTTEGECFRRYPLVWNILGCVFMRIPLFSLAKSLSERQFISVLRQSLAEFAKPRDGAVWKNPDVEMVDAPIDGHVPATRKRKRSSPATFDLRELQETPRCLESAASAFDAVRFLMERIDVVAKGSHETMGAEHVKSLFSSSAKDTTDLIRPMVDLCDLALFEQFTEPFENQKSWTTLIQRIWDFHLQGQQDSYEVATALSQSLCSILSKLLGYRKQQDFSIDSQIKLTWTKDLRRFYTKIMIMPARSFFMSRKDLSVLETAVEIIKSHVTTSAPVLFDLALEAPVIVGEASAKKDNEEWIQKVFDVLEEPLRHTNDLERTRVVSFMLEMARDHGIRLSTDNLRAVCSNYAVGDDVNWELLYRISVADTDVFLISQDGIDLLTQVLDQTLSPKVVKTDDHLVKFIASLANGFAKSRDLSGFVKKWFEYLDKALANPKATSSIAIWSNHGIRDVVSSLVEVSMTSKQLLSLLDWLDAHESTSQSEALLVILDAISKANFDDEYVDAINTRLFDISWSRKPSASVSERIASLRWSVTRRTLSWVSSHQSREIWDKIRPELRDELKKGSLSGEVTLESFRCAYVAWVSGYPGGGYESEAGSLVSDFLGRLNSSKGKKSVTGGPEILDQLLYECPRLLALTTKNSGQSPGIIRPVIARTTDDRHTKNDTLAKLLANEHNLNNRIIISNIINEVTQLLSTDAGYQINDMCPSRLTLFRALLDMPQECFSRDQRELIMLSLLKLVRSQKPLKKGEGVVAHWKIILSLMAKLMRRPTFYENMKFIDLVDIGNVLMAASLGVGHLSAAYEVLRLFTEYAELTLRQMTSNLEVREREYLAEVAEVIASWSARSISSSNTIRLLLSSAMTTALEQSSNYRSSKQAPIDLEAVRQSLSVEAKVFLRDIHLGGMSKAVALINLEELNAVTSLAIQEQIQPDLEDLGNVAEKFCTQGLKAGWKLKTLLVNHFKQHLPLALDVQLEKTDGLQGHSPPESHVDPTFETDRNDILEYINTAIDGLDNTGQLQQLRDLLSGLPTDSMPLGKLLAVHRLVDIQSGPDTLVSSRIDNFDLATAHSILSRHLLQATTEPDFALTAQIMHTLLDKRASAMSQWNIEVTLSTVSTICEQSATDTKYSRKGYILLCQLVEIIIKRHRLRLEGHFHLLISVLQSLLIDLLSRKPADPKTISRRDDAKSYSRLLTLVCEPTVASVTRSQPSSLDSATDAAKRLAGQHMYLVLMLYIKLQLEKSVSHDVQEALEPGIYSILDISPTEIRRIMNDAMDGSGRAIFRELYKQYLKFGKWSGI